MAHHQRSRSSNQRIRPWKGPRIVEILGREMRESHLVLIASDTDKAPMRSTEEVSAILIINIDYLAD
jgi:hypothetical protein